MKRIKVKMIGTGKEGDPFRVALPTWHMDRIIPPDYIKMECYVWIHDDETYNELGKDKISQSKIRQKYKENWSNFDKTGIEV